MFTEVQYQVTHNSTEHLPELINAYLPGIEGIVIPTTGGFVTPRGSHPSYFELISSFVYWGLKPTLLALNCHDSFSEQAKLNHASLGINALTLPEMIPGVSSKTMQDHADFVHFALYLISHTKAWQALGSAHSLGLDLERLPGEILTDEVITNATLVDHAIGNLVYTSGKFPNHFKLHGDWGGMLSLFFDQIETGNKPDMIENRGVVPYLQDILKLPDILKDQQIKLFKMLASVPKVLCVHTKEDKERLIEIANYAEGEHVAVPRESRAKIIIKEVVPKAIIPIQTANDHTKPAQFIRSIVNNNKDRSQDDQIIIAGMVSRLDPIKMDHIVLERFKDLILKMKDGSEEDKNFLKNLRIAWISAPTNRKGNSPLSKIYSDYNDLALTKIHEVNSLFKEHFDPYSDFILPHMVEGQLAKFEHEKLYSEVYNYLDIVFQLGQEGLCKSGGEAALQRAFGSQNPNPIVQIYSAHVGASSKARENNMFGGSVLVLDEVDSSEQFIATLGSAVILVREIKESKLRADIRNSYIEYYGPKGSSYFEGVFKELLSNPLLVGQ